ncbi:hypothetical protein WR25_24112 [Diploscapter pachys]|uniref:Uncharacterized protein n=1 Tax=Diploscapter pachys TaxID=2018661 RepID=A0A2A2M4Q6_9BILA|nr:hypothetical protein WR25_24112 [Diploscapter pachys]
MGVERHAGRDDQPGRAREVEGGGIVDNDAVDRLRPFARGGVAVPGDDVRSGGGERANGRHAGTGEAEDGVALDLPGGGEDHAAFAQIDPSPRTWSGVHFSARGMARGAQRPHVARWTPDQVRGDGVFGATGIVLTAASAWTGRQAPAPG